MTLGSGSEWPGDVRFDPFATDLFELRRTPLRGGLMVAMRHLRPSLSRPCARLDVRFAPKADMRDFSQSA
jgi:hypothetical protein